MKLELCQTVYYRVKRGQTLSDIARTFLVPPRVLAAENGLEEDVFEGQVVKIPPSRGNLYLVRGGESKTLLCGSPEKFREKNATERLYPMQTVWI